MQLVSIRCVETFVFNNTMRNMSKETPIPPTIASLSILNGVNKIQIWTFCQIRKRPLYKLLQ